MGGIGESLRSTREAKGISLEQAEEDTKIRKRYLQALEDGDYDVIPGQVYAKGFLRNYANYLGLDQEEVMLEYKLLGIPAKEEYKRVDIEASINKKKRLSGRNDRRTYLATVLIAVFAVLILVLYNFVFKNNTKIANQETDSIKTEQETKTKTPDKAPTKPSGQSPAQQPGAQNGNLPGSSTGAGTSGNTGNSANSGTSVNTGTSGNAVSGINLTLNGKDQVSWVRITVDGVVKFTGNLNPGESKTYSGTGKIKVRVGNAGAVEAILNGQNLGTMGALGQPTTREFSSADTTGGSVAGSATGGQNTGGGQ